MLFCITNKCSMECPHCMSSCTKDGQFFDLKDISYFANFFNYMGFHVLLISGGEPTEHPQWVELICALMQKCNPQMIAIISNGSFTEDPDKLDKMRTLIRKFPDLNIQITSVKGLYKNHNYIVENKEEIFRNLYGHVFFETDKIGSMKPLGRAAANKEAMAQVMARNVKYTTCTNPALLARQSKDISDYATNCEQNFKFCTPMVDYKLDLHMSESMLCPSVGNLINDAWTDLFKRMKDFVPCGKCMDARISLDILNSIK